jgi:hypothetical protein
MQQNSGYIYGGMIYPAAVAVCCFVICVPLYYIIDWAIPKLNGKSIRQIKIEKIRNGAKNVE